MFEVARSDFQGGFFFQNVWLSDACHTVGNRVSQVCMDDDRGCSANF